jgi:hypothetical protein
MIEAGGLRISVASLEYCDPASMVTSLGFVAPAAVKREPSGLYAVSVILAATGLGFAMATPLNRPSWKTSRGKMSLDSA